MAEVATKKSINVVSSKKSEVCGVQSNNGLIDLDNITSSNNQLISLCDNNDDDDDLILTNNTRNELDADDKSLQELIESELALRICSSAEDDEGAMDGEEQEVSTNQPETVKRIVLDRQQDRMDVNTEFIVVESEHCALIEEPYGYQNGHVSPETKTVNVGDSQAESVENVKPDPVTVGFRDKDEKEEQVLAEQPEDGGAIVIQKTTGSDLEQLTAEGPFEDGRLCSGYETENGLAPQVPEEEVEEVGGEKKEEEEEEEEVDTTDDAQNCSLARQEEVNPPTFVDKYQEEEQVSLPKDGENLFVELKEAEESKMEADDVWNSEQTPAESHQAGQFSDNFDETLCEQGIGTELADEETVNESVLQEVRGEGKFFGPAEDSPTESDVQESLMSTQNEPEVELSPQKNDVNEDEVRDQKSERPTELEAESEEKHEEVEKIEDEALNVTSPDELTSSQSEVLDDAASTQEFIDIERRILSEESNDLDDSQQETVSEDVETVQSAVTNEPTSERTPPEPVEPEVKETPEVIVDSSQLEESIEKSRSATEGTLIEQTEVIVSETNVTILSETKYVERESHVLEQRREETLDSWVTVEEAMKSEDGAEEAHVAEGAKIELESSCEDVNEVSRSDEVGKANGNEDSKDSPKEKDDSLAGLNSRAPLATPDDETSDISNACDSETREEITTTSSLVTTSSTVKSGTKTKKKKIEGVAGNDASPNLTPRTKKTKKSKKSDLEKENISVNSNLQDPSMRTGSRQTHPEMIDFSDEDDLSNVNVKSLTQNYVSEANRSDHERSSKERIATGVSIKQLCRSFGDISNMSDGDQTVYGKSGHMEAEEKARSMGDLRVCERGYSRHIKDYPVFAGVSVKALKSSFNKFDALSKKTVLHVRSVDAGKVQQQLNAVGQNGDTNPNCRSCGKVVFQMEQTKAEGLVWHKNCFRCVQCSKQLNVDNYESHESTLYCKPHFKELFQPKPVEESDQPVRPRKPEMIIRENEPKELPPDVVRASDKPDLGLEELSSLNVKSRFQVFEKAGMENSNEIERSPSQIAVKRSPSILSKLAKFQAKGMDIGVADESLNGIPYEESSESEEEVETEENEDLDTEIVKAKRATRERPISFSKMDDIKNRWESTSQQGRREHQREARKEEIAGIRSRLFMGKQGKMKEMYQQAVAGSERVTKINAAEEIQHSTHARSIKERFERGEPIAASDDEVDNKPKPEKADEEVIAAGISRKSRSLFLELDASAAKTGRPVTPVNPKTPAEGPRRARDAFMARQVSDDVVRSTDTTEEVQVETSDISNKFKFFESYKEPEKQRKQFRITPPRDGQVKMDSPEREIYRDPDVVRADDRVNEVVHTDTARKMLSIFRQMEENATKEELPDGPKPLKRFTPPPEDKFAKATASDSEEEEEEDGEESEGEDSGEEKDPNYVRASDKVEDEFLKQAQNAARAKTLRAKFEHWEETDGKVTSNHHHVAEMEIAQGTGDQSSIESASSLRARFESLGSQTNECPRTPKVKVNRFVEIQTSCMDVCESCEKKVYPLEKVETNNKIFHKQCFRCLQCNCVLRMDTFTLNNGKLYCIPHFKQLFITRGNYDEGFGVDPHKNKWAASSAANSGNPPPIAVSNGEL